MWHMSVHPKHLVALVCINTGNIVSFLINRNLRLKLIPRRDHEIVLSSPWFKWLIFGKAGSAAGYATFRCTWQRTRRYLCYDLVADHSRTRAAKVSSEQAGQSGFSALAACPHPATGAGSGSG